MGEEKTSPNISIGGFGWFTLQTLMLALRYGFNKEMPWWVTWFPSVVIGGIVTLILIILLIAAIIVGLVLLFIWLVENLGLVGTLAIYIIFLILITLIIILV